jgi:alkyl hydroperoxide reductase subunit AhpC
MAFNPFIGWTEAELLAERRKIQEEIASGGSVTSASAGDVTTQVQTQFGAMTRLGLVMRALHIIDRDNYPLTDLPRNRTVAVMGTGI